jgi:hypothetical protein
MKSRMHREVQRLRRRDTKFWHCPNPALKIGSTRCFQHRECFTQTTNALHFDVYDSRRRFRD